MPVVQPELGAIGLLSRTRLTEGANHDRPMRFQPFYDGAPYVGGGMGMGIAIDRADCPHPHVGPMDGKADDASGSQPSRSSPPPQDHDAHDHLWHGLVGGGPARNGGRSVGACVSISQSLARLSGGNALLAERDYKLWPREPAAGRPLAPYGRNGGAERVALIRAERRLPVRHDA